MIFLEMIWILLSFVGLWSAWRYLDTIVTVEFTFQFEWDLDDITSTIWDEMEFELGEILSLGQLSTESESESEIEFSTSEQCAADVESEDTSATEMKISNNVSQEKLDKFVDRLKRTIISKAVNKKAKDAKFVVTNAGRLCNLEMRPSPFSEELMINSSMPRPRALATIRSPLSIRNGSSRNITGLENSLLYKEPQLAIEWQADQDKKKNVKTELSE